MGGNVASSAWARSGCLLVDDHLALDTGGLASQLSLLEQVSVDHVLLTHAHLDHVGELAFLVDNVMTARAAPLKVWAPGPVLAQLRKHLFNDQLWPDFLEISLGNHPVLEFCPLDPGVPADVGRFTVRWARTDHPTFSAGYLVEDRGVTFLYTGDTGPTEELWRLANTLPGLRAVFVETAFPDRLQALAHTAGHLTPALLAAELDKLCRPEVQINIMHVKPVYQAEIEQELLALHRPFRILSGGEFFHFPAER